MSTIIDGLDPVELTVTARLAADEFDAQTQSLARFLPYNGVADIRYAYSKGVDALIDLATYRAFDAESAIGRRPGASRLSGELPPISRKIPLSEYASLRLRGATNDEIVAEVFADAIRLARGVAARVEVARGELFEFGRVTLDEDGVKAVYNAGRHASQTLSTLTVTDWSDAANADPIANIITWCNTVQARSGVRPNRMLVSQAVMALLQRCDAIRGWNVAVSNAPTMVDTNVVAAAISGLAGVNVEVYEAPAGLVVTPIDPDKIVLLRDNVVLGQTAYGTTLESQEPEYSTLGVQPGVVAGGWKSKDPITAWTHVAAIVLPLLTAPDATLAAKVTA